MKKQAGQLCARDREKSFSSLDDLHLRVPELRKDELRKLAAVGALNFIQVQMSEANFRFVEHVDEVRRHEAKTRPTSDTWTLDFGQARQSSRRALAGRTRSARSGPAL